MMSMPYSRRNRSCTISMCNRPRNPQRKPNPSATLVWRSVGLASLALYRPGDESAQNMGYARTALQAFEKYSKAFPEDPKPEEYIITTLIGTFRHDVQWGALDYLIVDMPPGTGDAQLSLAQAIQLAGSVIVTTPQEVAIGDALRSAKMFERVGVPVLGVVENMSYFACPHCGEKTEIFLSGGGQRLADEIGVPLMGQVPLQARMPDLGDTGTPVVVADPDSPAGRALRHVADEIRKRAGRSLSLPILTG
jgi:hypothetical protein